MKIDVLTLFPKMFDAFKEESIIGRAHVKGTIEINAVNFRDYSSNKHYKVDDYPYGGGQGMLLGCQPIFDAVEDVTSGCVTKPRVILLCPQGETFTQKKAEELSGEEHLVFLCGHYEGFDERIREHLVTDELSLGDFVLTGGETAAMVMIDSVVRLMPGVLGRATSHKDDSFSSGLLEFPQYTRPESFRGMDVPEVLLSGNHAKIAEWRREQSLLRTLTRRPDLLETCDLSDEDECMLKRLKKEIDV